MFTASAIMRSARPVVLARYWRVVWLTSFSSGPFYANAAEVAFSASLGGSQIGGASPFASSSFGTTLPNLAFDNDASTLWSSAESAALPQHIGVSFAAPTAVTHLKLQVGNTSTRTQRAPRTFRVEYSNDDVTYTTIFTSPLQGAWAISEVRNYSLLP